MSGRKHPFTILMADDDKDDCFMAKQAMQEAHLDSRFYSVPDGAELLDYLHRRGRYADTAAHPMPDLILLDLNMPKKDGREALAEIKTDPKLKNIPIVVLTTSQNDDDINGTYGEGASGYIIKPVTFLGLVDALRTIGEYWIKIVKAPAREKS